MTAIEGIAWPPVRIGQAAQLAALGARLEATQWLPPAAIRAGQARQLAALVTHHAAQSPFFARRLAAAGISAADIRDGETLRALPPLERQAMRGVPDPRAASVPPGHAPLFDSSTSGSTGEPVTVQRTAVSRLDWLAMVMREHDWQKRDFGAPFAAIRAGLKDVVRRPDWGPPAALLHRTGPAIGIPVTRPIEEQLALLRAFRPRSLLLYPSNLDGLLDAIGADGGGLEGLEEFRTMGEALKPETRERALALTGARVSDCYSINEAGYLALSCPESGLYHLMAETVLVELLDEAGRPVAPGAIGRVIVTDLRNFATPLIRYALNDHAEAGPACPCGRGLPTMTRIIGRTRNLLTLPNGQRMWPYIAGIRLREFPEIAQYRLVQTAADRIEVELVVDAPLAPALEEELRGRLRRVFGFPFLVDFLYRRERIAPGPAGKFEDFVSRIIA